MAKQLASVPEESSTDFTALSPRCYSYRESFWSVAGPKCRIRSTLSSIISGAAASSSYLFSISGSAPAAAAEWGGDELHQGRPSIHKVSTSPAKQLASVSEESSTVSTAPCPPSHSYRESIRSVAWPEWNIRSALSSLSGQSGSNYSSGSSALSSNNSGYSSGLGSAGGTDFCVGELTKIAHRMVSDGYTQRMVQEFGVRSAQDRALKNWFVELDVDWVLEIRGSYGFRWQWQLQPLTGNTSASSHQELIEKWVRALTIIVASIKKEVVAALHETWAVAHFGQESISKMLVFIDPILDVFKVENLQAILHMYICVSSASYDMFTMHSLISSKSQSIVYTNIGDSLEHSLISSRAQSIFTQIGDSLEIKADNLIEAISTLMKKLGMILNDDDDDDLWAIEILRGGGEVHTKTRLMVDCIVLMRKTHASTQNSSQSQNTRKLCGLIQDMIDYLNNLLLDKSELCLDPSLTYLFLLNNSYFVAQELSSEPSIPLDVELSSVHYPRLKLIPECQKYMDSYLDSSWGYVMSCILQSNSLGQPKNRKKISSLVKFQSAFYQTYQAQKFWKVPDPQLRSLMRETITKRVIPVYRDYLKGHPELEKQVRGGSNSPQVLEEMLEELFEG